MVKVLAVIAIALVGGLFGLSAIFSDLGPGESQMQRWTLLAGIYILGSMAIGVLIPRRWYMALSIAWGPVLLTIPLLMLIFSSGPKLTTYRFLLEGLIFIPAIVLVSGFMGSRLRAPHPRT